MNTQRFFPGSTHLLTIATCLVALLAPAVRAVHAQSLAPAGPVSVSWMGSRMNVRSASATSLTESEPNNVFENADAVPAGTTSILGFMSETDVDEFFLNYELPPGATFTLTYTVEKVTTEVTNTRPECGKSFTAYSGPHLLFEMYNHLSGSRLTESGSTQTVPGSSETSIQDCNSTGTITSKVTETTEHLITTYRYTNSAAVGIKLHIEVWSRPGAAQSGNYTLTITRS